MLWIILVTDGDRYVKSLTCNDQMRVMAFAQLTYHPRFQTSLNFAVRRGKAQFLSGPRCPPGNFRSSR